LAFNKSGDALVAVGRNAAIAWDLNSKAAKFVSGKSPKVAAAGKYIPPAKVSGGLSADAALVSECGDYFLSPFDGKRRYLIHSKTGRRRALELPSVQVIYDADVSSDGTLLAIAGTAVSELGQQSGRPASSLDAGDHVWVFRTRDQQLKYAFDMEARPGVTDVAFYHRPMSVAFSPDCKLLAFLDSDSRVAMWRMEDGINLIPIPGQRFFHVSDSRKELSWLASNERVAVTRNDPAGCRTWNAATGEEETMHWRGLPMYSRRLTGKNKGQLQVSGSGRGGPGNLTCIAVAPNGEFLVGKRVSFQVAAPMRRSSIVFVDLEKQEAIGEWPTGFDVSALRISQDSAKVAIAQTDGAVRIYGAKRFRELVEEAEVKLKEDTPLKGALPPKLGRK
jgi:WD40 repeat protein